MEKILFEIEMQDGNVMKGELYPEVAPITVENFVNLIKNNFFDGLIFHRVIPGFMIQGGGYDTDMKEHPAASIKGEFASNGVTNNLKQQEVFYQWQEQWLRILLHLSSLSCMLMHHI